MKEIRSLVNKIILLCILFFLDGCNIKNNEKSQVYNTEKIDTLELDLKIDSVEDKFIKLSDLPRKFDKVPAGQHVYRSNQPTIKQLEKILTNYPIETVVRMNDIEGTGVKITDEKDLVESMGKKFVWVNAHLGYEEGKGYIESLKQIQPHLEKGNALIHCTAGADRTGYQVAKFIMDKENWTKDSLWKYSLKYNDWDRHICLGRKGYIRYMEGFYPYEEWKQQNYCK